MTYLQRLEIELGISRQIPVMVKDSDHEAKYGWYDRLDGTSQCSKKSRDGMLEAMIERIKRTENSDVFTPNASSKLSAQDLIRELLDEEMGGEENSKDFMANARRWLRGGWVKATFNPDSDPSAIPVAPFDFTEKEAEYIFKTLEGEIKEIPADIKDFGVVQVDLNKTYKRAENLTDTSHIDLSLTNVKPDAAGLVDRVKAILNKPKSERPKNITILFHGIPGTGKTELAKYIASAVGKEVMKKTFGEIQSKYIGEGEKNLHEAFETAMAEDKVFLIDELDSISGNRESADKNWEKTMVNQLLAELDEFEGIFIGTTNRLSSFDPAILRRMHLKVEFMPLDETQVETAFKHFFPKLRVPKAVNKIKLLTPGDFHAVKNKSLYEPTVPTPTRIVELLDEEVKTKIKASPELSGLANKRNSLDGGIY